MNPALGWTLAAVALGVGWLGWGWRGIVLAFTVIVFWLLLQFNRALRAMRAAAGRPIGSVASAVMLQSKLRPGMTMLQVVGLARSLGERLTPDGAPRERWRWRDAGNVVVEIAFEGGKVREFELQRPAEPPAPAQ